MHLRSRWWLALLYCRDPVSRSATTPKVETRASCLLSRAFFKKRDYGPLVTVKEASRSTP
ncbi:BAL_1a_G0028770.mRNA.1.CDS.1 [Saccharomyces cerevisiae]|nr:BAL_1a_G0028770.mRNA.1.CDS.1 [Saccharomyces cerevisiae]CAI7173302.1 BAL_1a_G0028770.mRNA.1.CDS.1 [Saccharomyces cerevisiae]